MLGRVIMSHANPLEFQALTWEVLNRHSTRSCDDPAAVVMGSSYIITGFGRTLDGKAVRLTILDHRPSVYVRCMDVQTVQNALHKGVYTRYDWDARENVEIRYNSQWLLKAEHVKRHLLYGFRNGEQVDMLKLTCANDQVMRQMITALQNAHLRTCNGDLRNFNPLSAFFWEYDIKPCGWLRVAFTATDMVTYQDDEISHYGLQRSFCDIDLVVNMSAVTCLRENMDVAPLKVFSWDIEQNGIRQVRETASPDSVEECEDPTHDNEESDGEMLEEEKFSFPDSELPECEITCIALRASEHGRNGVELHCFTYKKVYDYKIRESVSDQQEVRKVVVHQGNNEAHMLRLFVRYLQKEQFDVSLGWNDLSFDFQAIHIRCRIHGVSLRRIGKVELRNEPKLKITKTMTQSRGNTEIKMFEIPGMVHHDLLRIWREDHKERSYGLEAVSSSHLGEHKLPMDPNHITSLAKQADPMGLTEVATYCAQDTKLPEALSKKYRKLLNLIMFCNVSQTLPNVFIQKGSNVRTMNLVGARLHRMGIVNEDVYHGPKVNPDKSTWKKYQGACVLEPERGKHNEPIATLDFAGLYPANINSQFIDYMRWVEIGGEYDNLELPPGCEYKDVEWVDIVYDKDNKKWNYENMKQRYVVGIHESLPNLMPTMMSELRKERKAGKKKVKTYKQLASNAREEGRLEDANENELLEGIWDANQLAIKLLMNAGYGFLGTPVSPLPHRGLAACVTYFGRFMLEQAQRYTLARYGMFEDEAVAPDDRTEEDVHRVAQGRSLENLRCDAKGITIVYGDTDSIMCKWKLSEHLKEKINGNVEEQNEVLRWVFDMAKEASKGASKYINRHFCHDTVLGLDGELKSGAQDLEFEKVFFPSHFYQRKRYLYRKIADKPDVTTGNVNAQGMAMVRRDISKISRELLWDCANAYMQRDYETIKTSMLSAFERMVDMAKHIGDPSKIDLAALEVTKQLAAHYKTKSIPPHAVVANKLKAPHRGENPMPGDRIGYVQIIDHPSLKKTEAVDAVKYILKEKLPVDVKQICDDMLMVLQQVIDGDSGIIVADVVKHLMGQVQAFQSKHNAEVYQQKTGNVGLLELGFSVGNENAIVHSDHHAVQNVKKEAERRAKAAEKKHGIRNGQGDLRAFMFKRQKVV